MIAWDTSASRKQDFCDARTKKNETPDPMTAEPFTLSSEPQQHGLPIPAIALQSQR
jgi:hypothetical protein